MALRTLAEAGCVIDDLDIPELSYAAMTSMITSSAESAGINRRWFRERHQDFVPHVARGLAVGMTITASEYLTVQRARHRIREALHQAYRKIDLIVSPTTPRVAPPISDGVRGNGDNTHHASNNHSNLLRFPSMLGLPGCSIPCGANPEGLPIGRGFPDWRERFGEAFEAWTRMIDGGSLVCLGLAGSLFAFGGLWAVPFLRDAYGMDRAAARAMLKAVGFDDDKLRRPIIGVANTWIEVGPCNFHLRHVAAQVKAGIEAAGGTPMEFNTIAISDGISMSSSSTKRPTT